MSRFLFLSALLAAAVAAGQDQPYRRSTVPNKELCLTWNTRNYVYNVDVAGSSKTPGESEFVAIDAAFQTWQTLSDSCSDFQYIRGPRIANVFIGKYPGSADNNTVTFRETNCADVVPQDDPCYDPNVEDCGNRYKCWDHADTTIGLTTTTFSFKTGQIFDADIEFNATKHSDGDAFLFTTVSSPPCDPSNSGVTCVSTDIQNTITHEIGHAMGLDHVDVTGSTMEPSAPIGETRKRVIDSGTAQGFCDTYPKGQPPIPCDELGQLRKKVIAKGTGTAGMESIGCGAAGGGGSWLVGALLALRSLREAPRVSRFTLLATLLAGSMAVGEGPSYIRSLVPDTEICLSWNRRSFIYNVDVAGSSQTPGESEFVAIDAAFQTWQTVADSCSDFQFIRGPRIAKVLIGKYDCGKEKKCASSDSNTVAFRETHCADVVPDDDPCYGVEDCGNRYQCWDGEDDVLAVTLTTFNTRTGQLVDADIEFNAARQSEGETYLFTTVSSPPCDPSNPGVTCVSIDVQNTITHEIGHALGLDHVDVPGSTMEKRAPPGETQKRVIDVGTAQGFCDTYPKGQPPIPCDGLGQVSKRVDARGTGTAGAEGLGCGAAGGAGASGLFALLALARRIRRRRA